MRHNLLTVITFTALAITGQPAISSDDPLAGYQVVQLPDEYHLFGPDGRFVAELTPAAWSVLVHAPTRVFGEVRSVGRPAPLRLRNR